MILIFLLCIFHLLEFLYIFIVVECLKVNLKNLEVYDLKLIIKLFSLNLQSKNLLCLKFINLTVLKLYESTKLKVRLL